MYKQFLTYASFLLIFFIVVPPRFELRLSAVKTQCVANYTIGHYLLPITFKFYGLWETIVVPLGLEPRLF